ncbi:unnamed protein product [Arctogadus glacialis]
MHVSHSGDPGTHNVKRTVVSGRGRGGRLGPEALWSRSRTQPRGPPCEPRGRASELFLRVAALTQARLTGGVARWQADPLLQASRDENRDEEERYVLKGFSSNVKGRILHVDVFGK